MAWTSHGYWVGRGDPEWPAPPRLACGGPHLCPGCALEAARIEEDVMQPPRLGVSPDDVRQMTAMFRVLGRFGRRLSQICDASAEALEDIAAGRLPARSDAVDADDEVSQRRADDDGMPPTA